MKSLSLSRPHLLITVGIPGSGKSFFAERFAGTFTAPYVDYSVVFEMANHNSHTSDIFAGYMLKELFKTNQSIVFDGPSSTRAERTALKELAESHGYTCLFIWVQTDPATAKARFIKSGRTIGRHFTASQHDALIRQFEIPTGKEHPSVVISGKHTYATQAKAVLTNLALSKQIVRVDIPRPQKPSGPVDPHIRSITVR